MRRLIWVFAILLTVGACGVVENASDGTQMAVQGEQLVLSGTITSRTPSNFARILNDNPQIKALVFGTVDGSIDGEATIEMGYQLRALGLATHLRADSIVDSGGVDLFIAGRHRTMARGASIGVHSWRNGYREGSSYPRNSPEHDLTRDYIEDMLGSDAFYWFTLQAAPSSGIYEMTAAEIARFGLLTRSVLK